MTVTWAPLLIGAVGAIGAAACAAAALGRPRLPVVMRVLLGVVAVPLAGWAFIATSVGLGFSGR